MSAICIKDAKTNIRLLSKFFCGQHTTGVEIAGEGESPCYRTVDGNLNSNKRVNECTFNGRKLAAQNRADKDEVIWVSRSC